MLPLAADQRSALETPLVLSAASYGKQTAGGLLCTRARLTEP